MRIKWYITQKNTTFKSVIFRTQKLSQERNKAQIPNKYQNSKSITCKIFFVFLAFDLWLLAQTYQVKAKLRVIQMQICSAVFQVTSLCHLAMLPQHNVSHLCCPLQRDMYIGILPKKQSLSCIVWQYMPIIPEFQKANAIGSYIPASLDHLTMQQVRLSQSKKKKNKQTTKPEKNQGCSLVQKPWVQPLIPPPSKSYATRYFNVR